MKQKINKMMCSKSDEWETPTDLYEKLNDEFRFTLDPACRDYNRKCAKYYTIEDNGLEKDWNGEIVFVNPPYGRSISKWVKKSYEESLKGIRVVMLIPARTDTKWFHDYILHKAEIRFIKGRLKFINRMLPSWREDGNFKISPAPFPTMIVIY